MKEFNIIVAMDANRGIGKDGGIPWDLPSDMAHFKEITSSIESRFKSNAVIMGRKTWESIPEKFRPLSDRINIVLTRNEAYDLPASVVKVSGLDAAFEYLQEHEEEVENVFVIGGAQVYAEAIKRLECKNLFITELFKTFDCDTFFPAYAENFQRVHSSDYLEENMITYHFSKYQRSS